MKLYSKTIQTPVAELTVICSDSHIIRLSFQNDNCAAWLKRYCGAVEFGGENELCRRCEEELTAYMEGRLTRFSLPVRLYGTEYEEKIWRALRRVPYGKTVSYAQIGLLAGSPGARAAGNALAHNPIAILFPCHRVIKADGSIGGFCGGANMIEVKRALLRLEAEHFA